MLKISHIKFQPIIIVLLLVFNSLLGCYMPGGAFLVRTEDRVVQSNDSLFVALPVECQPHNYFKVSYAKKNEVYAAQKLTDSTIVFITNNKKTAEFFTPFRVEYGILPFFEKN